MANIPYVEVHKDPQNKPWVIIVTSAHNYEDGFRGCHWHLYSCNGRGPVEAIGFVKGDNGVLEAYGYSKGYGGDGAGSALTAMANAKKAMRRRWKKKYGTSR